MLHKKLQKLILLIFIFSILFIPKVTQGQNLYETSLDHNAAKNYDFDYFDFSKSQYTEAYKSWPNLIKHIEEKTQKSYSDNKMHKIYILPKTQFPDIYKKFSNTQSKEF